MHKKEESKREKSLTWQIFLKWYLREAQVSRTTPPLPSSLLSGKKTLSQAEQKINEPTSDGTQPVCGRFLFMQSARGETAPLHLERNRGRLAPRCAPHLCGSASPELGKPPGRGTAQTVTVHRRKLRLTELRRRGHPRGL